MNSGARCLEEANSYNFSYCDLIHSCKAKSGLCENERINGSTPFCFEHSCMFPLLDSKNEKSNCKNERFSSSEFCLKHVCIGCLQSNSTQIKYRFPNACPNHKCSNNDCQELQIQPHLFCLKHLCEECAQNGLVKNLPIEGTSSLCAYHRCRVPFCNSKGLNDDLPFCSIHLCKLCALNRCFNGADLTCAQSQLCSKHRCITKLCLNEKITQSEFCVQHSCKECVSLKCAKIYEAVKKSPRNSCLLHPLVKFVLAF